MNLLDLDLSALTEAKPRSRGDEPFATFVFRPHDRKTPLTRG